VFNGLLVEDSDERVVLKIAGGEQQVIPRDEVEELRVSKLSLMPEELEQAMTLQQFRDLVAFLLTTEPPRPWSEIPDIVPASEAQAPAQGQ
jgi:putative heme-binding domain-containing protein